MAKAKAGGVRYFRAFGQVPQEITPRFLILAAAFGDAEDFTIALLIDADRHQYRHVLNFASSTAFQIHAVDKNAGMFADYRLYPPFFDLPIDLLIEFADGTRTDFRSP